MHEWRLGPAWGFDGMHEAICLTCMPKVHTNRMPAGSAPDYTEFDYWLHVYEHDKTAH